MAAQRDRLQTQGGGVMRRNSWIVLSALGAMLLASSEVGAQERSASQGVGDCRAADMAFASGDRTELVEFRDAFRPNSEEASKRELLPIAWSPQDRALVLGRLRTLSEQAPGLLQRAAADGALSLYRAELAGFSQAKGGYRRLAIGSKAFPYPGYDWLTRIIAHEIVHSADPYDKLTTAPEWVALIEPRITTMRSLLAEEGLTIIMAASMPLSDRRTKLEAKIRGATGLPSAYSGYSAEESLAEVVSFMLDKDQRYEPPLQMAAFLQERLLCPASITKDASGFAYRKGLLDAAAGRNAAAVAAFSEAIRLDPRFMLAYMQRANSHWGMNANAAAIQDFSKAIELSSLYSRMRPYLLSSRGQLRFKTGDVAGAEADCAAALPLQDNYYNALFLCGQVKLAKSDFDGAVADLEKAIDVLPGYKNQVDPWLEKARALQQLMRYTGRPKK